MHQIRCRRLTLTVFAAFATCPSAMEALEGQAEQDVAQQAANGSKEDAETTQRGRSDLLSPQEKLELRLPQRTGIPSIQMNVDKENNSHDSSFGPVWPPQDGDQYSVHARVRLDGKGGRNDDMRQLSLRSGGGHRLESYSRRHESHTSRGTYDGNYSDRLGMLEANVNTLIKVLNRHLRNQGEAKTSGDAQPEVATKFEVHHHHYHKDGLKCDEGKCCFCAESLEEEQFSCLDEEKYYKCEDQKCPHKEKGFFSFSWAKSREKAVPHELTSAGFCRLPTESEDDENFEDSKS